MPSKAAIAGKTAGGEEMPDGTSITRRYGVTPKSHLLTLPSHAPPDRARAPCPPDRVWGRLQG
jgi:hypothetical protein